MAFQGSGSSIVGKAVLAPSAGGPSRAASGATLALWRGVTISVLAAAVLFVPPVVYQLQNFFLGWHDVGNYTRANYNFFEFGRFAVFSDGSGDFFKDQHFEPFFFLLCLPVRLFGTAGFVGAVTAALVLAAGYVFALARVVTRSSWLAALCAAAYVINPYTGAIALSYHPETFGILFLLAFAYHNLVRQSGRTWLALLLAFTVKEDMWVYAVVVAILTARRDRLKQTTAFVAAAVCYYAVAVLYIGGTWYPTANYFNSFYEADGHPHSKIQIAAGLLSRWRGFPRLLFTGPGLLFQLTFLFACVLSGWRYVLACGVMLLWLTYPGGPPRSNLSYYYSYASLLLSFVILPYALVYLRELAAGRANDERRGGWAVGVAMSLVLTTCVVMHVPGCIPTPIKDSVDYRRVFSHPHHVNVPVVRSLVSHFLAGNTGSVLAQFWIVPSIPQHRAMYVTTFDRGKFLAGHIRPKYVLLDLQSNDPWTPAEDTRAMVALLRRGDLYRPLYDAKQVLLYQRVGGGT
jgi:hypothetical protein